MNKYHFKKCLFKQIIKAHFVTNKVRPKGARKTKSVPKAMQAFYDQIVSHTDAFCQKHLNEEYRELAQHMAAALCRKRPSPLVSGRPLAWACGIIYALGQINFLSDPAMPMHMKLADVCAAFKVGKSTASAKSQVIQHSLNTSPLDPTWSLAGITGANPMNWLFEVDGRLVDMRKAPREMQELAYTEGLIPFIPVDQEK